MSNRIIYQGQMARCRDYVYALALVFEDLILQSVVGYSSRKVQIHEQGHCVMVHDTSEQITCFCENAPPESLFRSIVSIVVKRATG